MFKVGDDVICLNPYAMDSKIYSDKTHCLTIYKKYSVIGVKNKSTITIMNDRNQRQEFNIRRFVLLSELRNHKINKICSRLVI